MRVSPTVLFVIIAIALPFLVQLKTLAGFVGYDLPLAQHAMIGALFIVAIVAWALWPQAWTPHGHKSGGQ